MIPGKAEMKRKMDFADWFVLSLILVIAGLGLWLLDLYSSGSVR